jgi:hypothetical protein
MNKLFVIAIALTLATSCTREKEAPKSGTDGKPLVTRATNPERVVFETDLDMPKDLQAKVKKTDLMIWDLKDQEGNVVAAQLIPVPTFPHKLTITGRQLFEPLQETGNLIFTARIVKFGDEGKPPSKGQLQVMVGMGTSEGAEVNNPAVDQKRVDKWMKKQKFVPGESISLGGKVKAEFAPATM